MPIRNLRHATPCAAHLSKRGTQRRPAFRRLSCERLESRQLLAADLWTALDNIPPSTSEPPRPSYINPGDVQAAFDLDIPGLRLELAGAPGEFTPQADSAPLLIELPTPSGAFQTFVVVETALMSPELAAKFPNITTYAGQGVDDPHATVRLDMTPQGFHAQVLSSETYYHIDPFYHLEDQTDVYVAHAPGQPAPFETDITSDGGNSGAYLSVVENTTFVTDVEGEYEGAQFYSYSLGGPDADLFTIDETTGVLAFKTAPDFESPQDTGVVAGDNVYHVRVAFGLFGSDVQSIFVTVTDDDDGETSPPIDDPEPVALPDTGEGPAFPSLSTGADLRTFRFAVAATGEYTQFHGGTVELGQSAVVTTVNRLTGIYERDAAVRFQLVADNDNLIYTDAATDPYTSGTGNSSWLADENETNVALEIGQENYDVGHVFTAENIGGVATLGNAGTARKAFASSGRLVPMGQSSYLLVAHEVGHQFGQQHTWSAGEPFCSANQFSTETGMEPGGGSTFMGYGDICGPDNQLQGVRDPYLHSVSLDQITNFIEHEQPDLGMRRATGNAAPVVDAGDDFVIPARTPFVLAGAAQDDDSDPLTFAWEQRDTGPQQNFYQSQREAGSLDNGEGPLFRSFLPTDDPTRTFPRLSTLIDLPEPTTTWFTRLPGTETFAGSCTLSWTDGFTACGEIAEAIPTTTRELNFRLTARDNRMGGGAAGSDDMVVRVVDTGRPFEVTSQNGAATVWVSQTSQTITWNVAGTHAAPIGTVSVNVLLSTDGGLTYPITLASDVPNDGAHTITVPDRSTSQARVRVEAVGNIFFDISNSDFTVRTNMAPTVPVDMNEDVEQVVEGAPSGTPVGLTAASSDGDGDAVSYSLLDDAGGRFAIDPVSGVVTVANAELLDGDDLQMITVEASDPWGGTSTADFWIAVSNAVPVAADDSFAFLEDELERILDLLANDSDPAGANDPLEIVAIEATGAIGATMLSDGKVGYSPAGQFESLGEGQTASDTFQYTISDGDGGEATATINITVTGQNDAPTVVSPIADIVVGQNAASTVIDLATVITDIDGGDSLDFSAGSSDAGIVSVSLAGNLLTLDYQPNRTGVVTITVTATDSHGAAVVTLFQVSVLSPADQVANLLAIIQQHDDDGTLNSGNVNALTSKLENALKSIDKGKLTPAVNQIQAFQKQVEAYVKSMKLSAEEGDLSIALSSDLIDSLLV